jgi:hypothetical protein
MNCQFNPNSCSVDCKKYLLCSYYSIQNQFSEVQSQLNFIYKTISEILKTSETAETKINLLESAVFRYVTDSYPIENIKESKDEEKNK